MIRALLLAVALLAGRTCSPLEPEQDSPIGKLDYFFRAKDLKTGDQRSTIVLSSTPEGRSCWISQRDIDYKDSLWNYVECEFTVVPEQPYRCWAYVGGCCHETLQIGFQATEGSVLSKGRRLAIDPGGNMADVVRVDAPDLPKLHAEHVGEKRPSNWMWVNIPLPAYPSGGLKKVRLLTHQKGFAVACFKVSAGAVDPPSAAPPLK